MTAAGLDQWWKGMLVAGVAVVGIGGVGAEPIALAAGLGLVFIGIGEWINHPYQERLILNDYRVPTHKISGHSRSPKLIGILFDGVGAILLIAATARIAISLFK